MLYQYVDDETLVMLTLAGEQSAYETLVVRHQKAVIASAMSVTRNRFMAEDSAQDAFVTAWMKLDTLQERRKFRSWVCRIAKNCARNMVMRMRSFMALDTVLNLDTGDDSKYNPAERYSSSEESDELHISIGKLPEKVKRIIHMHYFEGLSVAEIADRLMISEGTVKWQLNDGRKRIRKELCAMNEKYSDTLVQRVMKKVEELKRWQFRNDKSGFETVYKDVLREVENLPESDAKNHALADVLLRGWWWLPGEKNDELFRQISDAALESKNEEAMTFIVMREDSKIGWGDYGAKIDFIRDKQIPRLTNAGFKKTLGHEWFWLGYYYFRDGKTELGNEALDKAAELLCPSDAYYSLIPYARDMEKILAGEYKDIRPQTYLVGAETCEYRYDNGSLRFWTFDGMGEGYLRSIDREANLMYRTSCLCDGLFFADIGHGETYTGTDGTTLTFASDSETVETPAGTFEGCRLWITKHIGWNGKSVYKSWYKDGVGIVKHEHNQNGLSDIRLLSGFHIEGGSGLLPMAKGNSWTYALCYAPDVVKAELSFTVTYADENKVIITKWENIQRLKYDENSWVDMIQQISCDYWTEESGSEKLCDVSHAVERAELLAKTPMEKAHTKAAASVIRRIMATDPTFNPAYTATGHWNFFKKVSVIKKKDTLTLSESDGRWSFEWKNTGSMSGVEDPILYNDIYGILRDAANCIWSDEWQPGATPVIEYPNYDSTIKTKITCEDGGVITTKAGTFEKTIKLTLDINGLSDGLAYRGGKKVYYFAEGIGIIRTENEYCDGARTAVYELTEYEGTGDGYMPMKDGMMRRYDALNLTDGFVGSVVYTYVADDEGDIVIFADRTGIRELPPPITHYAAIQGELDEEKLWESGKHAECRLLHDINNYKLMLHFLCRTGYNRGAPHRHAAWQKYKISLLDTFKVNGELPRAWWGMYADAHFLAACALFGCNTPNEKEEGYAFLEKAFEFYPKWLDIPDGELLDTGNADLFGGIKLKKGSHCIVLPDGSRDIIPYEWVLSMPTHGRMYYGMTALEGWEWFNPVRNEERFKKYVERARLLAEGK